MKNIFKKISAVAASALMVGMTMGVAAAVQTYPAPFVEGGSADVAVVYGTGAGVNPSDLVYAGQIEQNLADSLGTIGGTPTGDSILLERDTDKFNLMNNMSTFFSKLDSSELTTILADGIYTNDAHDDFDYEQEITLSTGIQMTHFLDSKFNGDKPIIGFDIADGKHLLNYTLDFTPDNAEGVDSDWSGIENTELTLFGKAYYVLSMTNTTATNHKITLLNAAVSATLNKGEQTTLTTDDASYAVSISYLDNSNVKLIINGEPTDSLIAGETQKLEDGSYVGIKDVASEGVDGQGYVEFSIGSGKLVLENLEEVEINNEKLSKTEYPVVGSDETISYKVTAYINIGGAGSETDLDNIVLDWETDDASWIAPGTDMVLPGFETIKLSMTDFITSAGEDTTFQGGDATKFEISTTITDGDITLPIFYMNSSATGIDGLGKSATEVLATGNSSSGGVGPAKGISISLNETLNNYFVVTWIDGDESECYAYELDSVDEDEKNRTVLSNLIASGSDITLDEEGASHYDTDGNVKFVLDFAEEEYGAGSDAFVKLNISAVTSGKVYTNRIATADGLLMTLPVENSTKNPDYTAGQSGTSVGDGMINTTATAVTTWTMNLTEEDVNDNIGKGKSFTVVFLADDADGLEPTTIAGQTGFTFSMHESEDGSKEYEGYVPSDFSTYLFQKKPTSGLNDLIVTYFGAETYGQVYVTEGTSTMSGATSTLGAVLIEDTDVSSVSSNNLIVIGGSCINSAAATLIGSAACESDFTTETGIGSGQFLIQSFGDAYATGKIALLVAGYEAADTINAVTYLKTQTVDTTAGKKYKGTSSSSATLVVE